MYLSSRSRNASTSPISRSKSKSATLRFPYIALSLSLGPLMVEEHPGEVGGDGGGPAPPLGAEHGDNLSPVAGSDLVLEGADIADGSPDVARVVRVEEGEVPRPGPHGHEDVVRILVPGDDDDHLVARAVTSL